ncbi:hypothetical protein [Rhodospirillum centenum]|uniref:hypothetical protein n=1 Tax=Rhodospirillum centenum TaxID=34018 RepID=UPI00160C5E5E|nr:hypothetical protein [Rhodospirillum centenum]
MEMRKLTMGEIMQIGGAAIGDRDKDSCGHHIEQYRINGRNADNFNNLAAGFRIAVF